MRLRRWIAMLAVSFAVAQEGAPFPEPRADPWVPAWELSLRGDRFVDPESAEDSFRRAGVQLRLRWAWDWDRVHAEFGTRSAIGSDSNRLNPPRWDNQPSNGTQLDVARVDLSATGQTGFAVLRLGLQEAGLLVSPGAWDRNLRFLGVGGGTGWRSGAIEEAGLRVAAGRVRTILGGEVDLEAVQAVLKADTGPLSWTADLARWDLRWSPGIERLRALPGRGADARQHLVLDALGGAVRTYGPVPVEARWFRYRNAGTREDSEEVQLLLGGRERPWWPQLICTWQRLSSTGTLYPVNGDEWWFYRGARGPRFELAVPAPGHWLASLAYLRQRSDREDYSINRTLLTFTRRF